MNGAMAMEMVQKQEMTKPLTRERMGQMLAEVEKQNHWISLKVALRDNGSGYFSRFDNDSFGYFNSDEEFYEVCSELIVRGRTD